MTSYVSPHHGNRSFTFASDDVDYKSVADPIRRAAVTAFFVIEEGTAIFIVVPLYVLWGGYISCPENGVVQSRTDFIHTDNKIHFPVSEEGA